MIIFISDLHLTDGTFDFDANLRHDTSDDAFRLFWDDIYSIIHGNDPGQGVNVKDIKIVLLGDILELRTTTRWVQAGTSPWREEPDRLSGTALGVLQEILEHIIYEDVPKKILRKRFLYLSDKHIGEIRDGGKFIEIVNERRNKGYNVSFSFVAGNHDKLIVDASARPLRDILENELGWEIIPASEEAPFEARFIDHNLKVIASHGHRNDFVDYSDNFKKSPLGDLLPDVLGRMMFYAQRNAPNCRREIVNLIMNIDLVRPFGHTFDWLLGKIKSLEADPSNQEASCTLKDLRPIFINTLSDLMKNSEILLDFIYSRAREKAEKANKLSVVIGSAVVMNLSLLKNLFRNKENAFKDILKFYVNKVIGQLKDEKQSLSGILEGMNKLIGKIFPSKKNESDGEDYQVENAKDLLEESNLPYAVLGHSHDFGVTPLRVGANAFYFNAGTWKKTVVRNKPFKDKDRKDSKPEDLSFQKWAKMTYVIFFEQGEMKDHIFDLWHGNLQFEDDKDL